MLRIKIKKGRKPSIILLTLALFALWLLNVSGNFYIQLFSALFALSVIAAQLTETALRCRDKRV
ncbi:hypothetical protein B5P41_06395 [Bacillus sp. SRB_28]|uniref:Uncharacterized protein n=1 Tax=Bacillus mycoides TaxID=1405 RepID=A0A654BHH6_BACMY|nr:hypothetical protein IG7_02760 [Bacillus cereus HuA2-4]RAN90634.1 hypothetical protein B5P41_06395 [Bacillus sp. SRB_28]GAE37926.1 hypothetical protein BW1_003_00400 [Bacillus mycoides NBRC 101238 = DSM 11821]VXC79750.1 conserved hypothetical protein [Bacillus mycoides]